MEQKHDALVQLVGGEVKTIENVGAISADNGVFQIADPEGNVLYTNESKNVVTWAFRKHKGE